MTMKRIEFTEQHSGTALEDSINDWINANEDNIKIIDIKFQVTVAVVAGDTVSKFFGMIIYEV